jgi:hypothetical protein
MSEPNGYMLLPQLVHFFNAGAAWSVPHRCNAVRQAGRTGTPTAFVTPCNPVTVWLFCYEAVVSAVVSLSAHCTTSYTLCTLCLLVCNHNGCTASSLRAYHIVYTVHTVLIGV